LDIGFAVNEFEVREQNGINAIYSNYPPAYQPYLTTLQGNNYNFYVRNTINYSLECEAQGKTRQQAYESFQSRINYPVQGEIVWAKRMAKAMLWFGVLGGFFACAGTNLT